MTSLPSISSRAETGGEAAVRTRLTALRVPRLTWERAALTAVLTLAAGLELLRLNRLGYGNTYYAAAVRSMLDNWKAFFFASFDAAGFVTVDKPPAGLWVQTAFAKLFGFHGVVLLLPSSLSAIASVALVYHLVRRGFGAAAGLLAALAMAVTPIAVAASRTNNLDSLLVLVLLLAAWAVLKAAETGRLSLLLGGAALVGLGFTIKMLQAYLVVPAFALVYLVTAPVSVVRRIGQLALAGAVLAAVSLSWPLAVELTPTDQRPYIGSSKQNSALDLAFGYNGLSRLEGMRRNGAPAADRPADAAQPARGAINPAAPAVGAAQGAGTARQPGVTTGPAAGPPAGFGGGPGGEGENGAKGVLRLFNRQLAGQISWLLPLALLAPVVAWKGRPRLGDRRQQSLIMWGTWLLTAAAFFSVAGFYHTYYLTMLAAPVAALAAIAATALWGRYRAGGRQFIMLPVALAATAAVQVYILRDYPLWRGRLVPVVIGGSGLLVLVLIAARFAAPLRRRLPAAVVAAVGAFTLLAAPTVWAAGTTWESTNTTLPVAAPFGERTAGPFGIAQRQAAGRGSGEIAQPNAAPRQLGAGAGAGGVVPPVGLPDSLAAPPFAGGGPGAPGFSGGVNAQLVAYLEANQGSTTYLAATRSAMEAGPLIIRTGKAVMAMGGFSGGDPILTPERLAAMVKAGEVRFFLGGGFPGAPGAAAQPRNGAPAGGAGGYGMVPPEGGPQRTGGFAGPAGTSEPMQWVTANCRLVPPATWQGGAGVGATATTTRTAAAPQLYDCANMTTGTP